MIGVLLLNTGTPEKPERFQVARYLREFLMDPRVIDLPAWIRWPLVNLAIIPTRTSFSTRAYQQIWTAEGSPLLYHSSALKKQLAEKLGENYCVELGMRYGQSNIVEGLKKLQHCSSIVLLPLFPQYASASSGSALALSLKLLSHQKNIPSLHAFSSFYETPGFIQAYAQIIKKQMSKKTADFVLFSYHGLPERQNNLSVPSYSEQCYATSRALGFALKLLPSQYGTAFQSRLGKTPWIKPYSDEYLKVLIQKGVKNLLVACPSFTADCLETLEEVGVRLKSDWMLLGGQQFDLSPCLNAEPFWVDWLAQKITCLEVFE